MAGWKITSFNREYIFNPGPFSIAKLVYQRVVEREKLKKTIPTKTPPVLYEVCKTRPRQIVGYSLHYTIEN